MAETNYTGPVNPDFRGGYAGEATYTGGGGYDPRLGNTIGGSTAITQNYVGAPDYRGGYAGEPTAVGGGGFDPNQGTARNIGTTQTQAVKPDGTPVAGRDYPSNLNSGSVTRNTGKSPDRATDSIKNDSSSRLEDPTKIGFKSLSLPSRVPNPFEEFASMTPLFTFACLEPAQYNNPQTYRNSYADLKHIIFSSAGRFDAQREKTAYDQPGLGPPEYYVNSFNMQAVIAPTKDTGATNAFKFEFTIYEPHSMGLLLQSLQVAAINAGYINYLNNTPFLLRLDFVGYKEDGTVLSTMKPKFFTMLLTKVGSSVNEGGSTYQVEAVPYSQLGFSDLQNIAYNDVKIVAKNSGTVKDILSDSPESLVKVLNAAEQKLAAEGKIGIPDEYAIEFPPEANIFNGLDSKVLPENGATKDPNETPPKVVSGTKGPAAGPSILKATSDTPDLENDISRCSLGFTAASGGNFPFKKEDETVDPKTGVVRREGMTFDPKLRAFQFTQGQSIISMIENVINNSDYVKKAMDPNNQSQGFIRWYKIDVQIELKGLDPEISDYARKTTFRVVPYWVHSSIFTNPNAVPQGTEDLKKRIAKGYEYIYTGQNADILNFQIDIKNLFFTGANASPENESSLVGNQDQKGSSEELNKHVEHSKGTQPAAQLATYGRPRVKKSKESLTSPKGGPGDARTEKLVADAFHRAFIESGGVSLMSIELEILGDPYWIVDSGVCNYFSTVPDSRSQITDDGTMNYEAGEVYIYISFRSPIDINENTGLYDFPRESPFSGIYLVTKCETTINDAVFKQRLTCVRMIGQSADFKDNPELGNIKPSKENSLAVSITSEEKPRSAPIDETFPGILISNNPPPSQANSTSVARQSFNNAPDFRGGYAGEATATGGGGFDPSTGFLGTANTIGGAAAITATTPVAPNFSTAGGYVPGQVESTGGGA